MVISGSAAVLEVDRGPINGNVQENQPLPVLSSLGELLGSFSTPFIIRCHANSSPCLGSQRFSPAHACPPQVLLLWDPRLAAAEETRVTPAGHAELGPSLLSPGNLEEN